MVVLSGWLDLTILEVFSNLWAYDSMKETLYSIQKEQRKQKQEESVYRIVALFFGVCFQNENLILDHLHATSRWHITSTGLFHITSGHSQTSRQTAITESHCWSLVPTTQLFV